MARKRDDVPTIDEAVERLRKLPKNAQRECLDSLLWRIEQEEWVARNPKKAKQLEDAAWAAQKKYLKARLALDEARRG